MHSKLDLNLYKVLHTIYVEGSITSAAERLFVTQPSISHALARLRDYFDDELFFRRGRKMVPTEKCAMIMPDVIQAIELLNKVQQSQSTLDLKKQNRVCKLGFRDVMEALFFPTVVPKVSAAAPMLRLHSTQCPSNRITQLLRNGQFDLVVDTLFPIEKDINTELLGHDYFVMVCRKGHPIEQNRTLENYLKCQHVVASLRDTDINIVDRTLTQIQNVRDIVLRCENFQAAINVVCESDLIMTLPSRAAKQFSGASPISVLEIPFEIPKIALYLYWHTNLEHDPVISWLRELIIEHARELLRN